MVSNNFTVVGGKFRGSKLMSPDDVLTHPMGAREKNALFNRLAGVLDGAKVLDAYAGSGALAIEALSRGASEVVLVEKSPKIARVAEQNLERVVSDDSKWSVLTDSVGKFADESNEAFDIIIADPPYDKVDLVEIEQVARLLKEGGIFVLSHPAKMENLEIDGLEMVSDKTYAGAGIAIYEARKCAKTAR